MTTSAWATSGDFSYDLGAAIVNTNAGSTLTDRVGSRGAGFNQAAQQRDLSHGYPAASPFNGERHTSALQPRPSRQLGQPADDGDRLRHDRGLVGRRLVVGNNVLSVNSYGCSNERNVMYGPYQGSVAQQLYTSASSG